jgi:hypothetical protein
MSKEYKAIVTMDDLDSLPPNMRSGIRPGMSAQIKIDVTDPNLEVTPILVPVLSLFEHAGKFYCITCDNGVWAKVPVEVGATNDKEVIIKSGLEEGTRVVQGAWNYIKHVLTEEELAEAREFGAGGARQGRGGRGPGGPGTPPPGGIGGDSQGGPPNGFGEPGGLSGPPSGFGGPGVDQIPRPDGVPGVGRGNSEDRPSGGRPQISPESSPPVTLPRDL